MQELAIPFYVKLFKSKTDGLSFSYLKLKLDSIDNFLLNFSNFLKIS